MTNRCLMACCSAVLVAMMSSFPLFAQVDTATLSGRITDPQGSAVPKARVLIVNIDTNISMSTETNNEGIYVFTGIKPARYRLLVLKDGFHEVIKPEFTLQVQDHLEQNFGLQVGSVSETVTVTAGAPMVNTESAAVSTVVDRQFAENLPLNGRSFQTLIELTPGVVLTPSNLQDSGQFSVNGQRANANYWMVDGVSANFGVSPLNAAGNGIGGSLGSFSTLGGTNSLVSVDALQEFRIQTSTYAPEFGRTPGGQISIITRSGTNQFHGTLFDYLRNDILDANDWFANSKTLTKPKERQNDFGGTFSGPVLKDRTFFFFSYEGLRLRLPQVALTTVPDVAARQNAVPAMQPFLNAFPLPNGSDNAATGVAQFNASFSNAATLDAYSLRIDHKLSNKLSLFGRYNYSPSELVQRGGSETLSVLVHSHITTQTATVGSTWIISPAIADDLRFNYSRANANSFSSQDQFGGAVPLASLPFPSPYTAQNAALTLQILPLAQGLLGAGDITHHLQRQVNIVDNLSVQKGSHSLKFGVDFRRLSPLSDPQAYNQFAFFLNLPSAETGNPIFSLISTSVDVTFLFRNLGVFAQDTWRVTPRLTVSYGLRWDVDFAPSSINGPSFPAVTGFNFNDLSNLALAPAGTPPFSTPYGNVAPRIGIANQLSQRQGWESVLRGGFGVFYDLATQELGNNLTFRYPFGTSSNLIFGSTFPLSAAAAAPPPITPPNSTSGTLNAFDPHLRLPYTLQWNVSLEQALGRQQTLSASYVGAAGRRLIQSAFIAFPNPGLAQAVLISNRATSDYHALQVQLQRRLSHGLQALASYTWSHSIDTASAGSIANGANEAIPTLDPNANRGPSDFDIRHAFSAGLTYDIPAPRINAFTNAILRGWSLQSIIQARSAPPVNVFTSKFPRLFSAGTQVRPDAVAGQPFYLFGPQDPGGKAINPAAFTSPPVDSKGNPLREGNVGRNTLRGFGATQWDFAVHRDFPVREWLRLQFRAEMFNVLNHPNFGQPVVDLNSSQFGRSTQMLGRSLAGGVSSGGSAGGAFDALYQVGGPRSIEFALKLQF